jgi:hypothetical protein
MANGGVVRGKRAISEAFIDDVFTANEQKKAWKNGKMGRLLKDISFYSNQ